LLNDVVDLICERKDLTAVIYDICNYQESDSGCAFGKITQVLTSLIFMRLSQYIATWRQVDIIKHANLKDISH
jgi:hypothetical protein